MSEAKLIIDEIKARKRERKLHRRLNLIIGGLTLAVSAFFIFTLFNNTDYKVLSRMDTKTSYIYEDTTVWEFVEDLNLNVDTREAIHFICKLNNVENSNELIGKNIIVPSKGEVVIE